MSEPENTENKNVANGEFKISSPAFEGGNKIPVKHTCDGQNTNPPLEISGVPEGTKSLVLIMEDMDAVSGAWYHWITFNIPPDTTEIPEGSEPVGISGKGTSGNLDYFGPCPPDGEHTYVFTVYAISDMIDLKEGAIKEEVDREIEGKIISKVSMCGKYMRNA